MGTNHPPAIREPRATPTHNLARAANGTLPKSLVAHWLANDFQYLAVYKGISEQTLAIVRRAQPDSTVSDPEDVQARLAAWLEAAVQNGTREENLFQEVAEMYKFDIRITDATKNEGLRRYESLYKTFTTDTRDPFLPWLEGAFILWAMEKVYYEAWNWAEKQDAQEGPKTYRNDEDGGAMRKEFIPNWSNRDFLMFVEQLERIINEGVSTEVKGDDELWGQVKTRTEAVWRVLDAEEVFWPGVDVSVRAGADESRAGRI
jgi:thiaminase